MSHIQWRRLAILLLAAACFVDLAEAQLTRGFLSGTITDPSNLVISQARVLITNKQTGIMRDTTTNEVGFYRFAGVEPGKYTVEFKMDGFATSKVDNIEVRTAQEVVINQSLSLGSVTTELSVTETPGAELAKTTATVERTFSDRVVSELPMPITSGTRDITRLALLAPTVSRASSFTEFSANGQRSRNNNFTIDGVDNNDLSVTTVAARTIPEAVHEVQVQTQAYSAEFGRTGGAQFSAITRSGTNDYHGEAWDYYRGNWMEPLSLANKRAGLKATPRFVLNQFGGDFGGPIFKDRTFFFVLLEANRRREAPSAGNASSAIIPTPAGYATFASVPLAAGQTQASRQAVLSALGFLPEVHALVANYGSLPNVTVNGVPIQVGSIRIPISQPSNFWYNVVRLDHRFNDSNNLTYRYHFDKRDQPNLSSNTQFGSRFAAAQQIQRQNHAASYSHIFSNRFLNEARLAFVRSTLAFPESDPNSSTVTINNFFTIGGLSSFPQGRSERLYQFQDVATYIAGRNSFKFGMDTRRNNLLARFGNNSKGTWTFSTLADFLNNNALSLVQAVNESTFDATQWNHSYFFQDDLKASRDFTLNLGIRYEYATVPLGFFGATDPAIRSVGIPGPARPDKNNWAPRLGFAYSLGEGRTVVRGGYGMAFDALFYNILFSAANNYPRIVTSTTTAPATANLFPTLAPKVAVVPPLNPLTVTAVNVPENIQNPATNFWSLSLQREFSTGYTLELGYAGSRSYHQIRQRDANPGVLTAAQAATVIANGSSAGVTVQRLHPAWGPRTLLEAAAKAEYHAGYVRFDRRLKRGLLVGSNYTWSANFSDNDEPFGANDIVTSSPQVPQDFFNYRNEWSRSAFDRPQRFSIYYLYEIPWFASLPRLQPLLGGWEISGFTDAQSGQPFTIRTGVDTVGTLAAAFPGRPNYNPNGAFQQDPDTGDLRTFKTATDGSGIFVAPRGPNGILANSMPGGGNVGRNTLRGPSFQNWNFTLMKRISMTENLRLQFRSDFINLLNHNNFQNPVGVMSSQAFGQNTAPLLTDTRQILFSAKILF